MEVRDRRAGTPAAVSVSAVGRRVAPERDAAARWLVAEEVPTAILYNGESFAVMMTTPADLADFAVGFTVTEGVARDACEIGQIRIASAWDGYVVNVTLPPAASARLGERGRSIPGRSGCGVCGAQTIAAALPAPRHVRGTWPEAATVRGAFDALSAFQPMNRANRSTHAAAFCTPDGDPVIVREDIGRHNALDKVAGALVRGGRDAADGFLILTSRCSVELVQKTTALGTPFLASISAPTALALRTAARAGLGVGAMQREAVMIFDTDAIAEDTAA